MKHRFAAWSASSLAGAALALAQASAQVSAQAPVAKPAVKPAAIAKKYTAPRTPEGQPDLQGIWSNATITPLERPADLAGKASLSAQEAADYEAAVRKRNNMDSRAGAGTDADVSRAYNDFWWDRGTKVVGTRRTSLIVDPSDGKLPALTPEAQKQVAARAESRRLHPSDGPEDRALSERCINWATAGPPMMPSAYNNNYQIVQTRDFVAISNEQIHDMRMIPLDNRPHVDKGIRQWLGDSRGHWEGDTLVVETTNFSSETAFRGVEFGRFNHSENMHLTERFTRVAPDTLLYSFTVDDPAAFTHPWTAEIPSEKIDGPIFEYACHEGNYGMTGILSGARGAEEKAAAGR
ncbi:MAG TPA: hypothetical protein VN841_27455 [Bryobacteraceae bacterium]|nr:hypothetical protein [Bryobacteraceae bacterium]